MAAGRALLLIIMLIVAILSLFLLLISRCSGRCFPLLIAAVIPVETP